MPGQENKSISTDFYAPTFTVEINGQELSADISNAILNVTVNEKIKTASTFSLQIDNHELKWQDSSLFKLGNEVIIKMGYVNNLHQMILGKITGIQVSYPGGGAPTLNVRGVDMLDKVIKNFPKKTVSLDDTSYSAVVQQIAQELHIDYQIDPTKGKQKKVVIPNDRSYFIFLNELARRLNYVFYVRDRKLFFIKQKLGKEVFMLKWGESLISFSSSLSIQGQFTEVEVRGYNPHTKEKIVGTASASDIDAHESKGKTGSQLMNGLNMSRKKTITNRPIFTQQEADDMAKSELKKLNSNLVNGDGSCIGIPELKPNSFIVFQGLGTRFDGKYVIETATHSIGSSGYMTNFSVKRNSNNEPS